MDKIIFKSFKSLLNEIDDVSLNFDPDELSTLGDEIDKDKEAEEKNPEDEYKDISRFDKEAHILANTEKTEDELNDFSDAEIDTMYTKMMEEEKKKIKRK